MFKAKGVDAIALTSVNDPFVLAAWAEATGAKGKIDFLADGSAAFAKALGLDLDLTERGMGVRSRLFGAGQGRRGEGTEHRAAAGRRRSLGRGAYSGADPVEHGLCRRDR